PTTLASNTAKIKIKSFELIPPPFTPQQSLRAMDFMARENASRSKLAGMGFTFRGTNGADFTRERFAACSCAPLVVRGFQFFRVVQPSQPTVHSMPHHPRKR